MEQPSEEEKAHQFRNAIQRNHEKLMKFMKDNFDKKVQKHLGKHILGYDREANLAILNKETEEQLKEWSKYAYKRASSRRDRNWAMRVVNALLDNKNALKKIEDENTFDKTWQEIKDIIKVATTLDKYAPIKERPKYIDQDERGRFRGGR